MCKFNLQKRGKQYIDMVFIMEKPNFFPGFYEKAMIQTTLTFM